MYQKDSNLLDAVSLYMQSQDNKIQFLQEQINLVKEHNKGLSKENAELRDQLDALKKSSMGPDAQFWREGFRLLADCYTRLKDDFTELRSRFEGVHGETMRPPMYEAIEGKKREKLEQMVDTIEKKM